MPLFATNRRQSDAARPDAARPDAARPDAARLVADRAGSAGAAVTLAVSLFGISVGAVGGYLRGLEENPVGQIALALDLREAPLVGASFSFGARGEVIERVLSGGGPERFAAPKIAGRPKIILIFDDMGPDPHAFEEIMGLPGPVTHSFLPYSEGSQAMADRARARGDAVMLHLPMEPQGDLDPGPGALRTDMSEHELFLALKRNLDGLKGYVGVNNHMGSRLTEDRLSMEAVLAGVSTRGVFFLDSLTTGKSVAAEAGRAVGATIYQRDVFLDAVKGEGAIMRQLVLAERIATETGFAVAIAHPRRETLDALGPWLTSAPARGFELATVEALDELRTGWTAPGRVAFRD